MQPQLVTLSGKKKKKRKRTLSDSEENVAVSSVKEEQTSEVKKSPVVKKKIVVLSHSGASPTAKTKSALTESKEVLSPRKVVKKVKTKPSVVSPKEVQSVMHKTQKMTEKKKKVEVNTSKSTVVTTSPKATKLVQLTRKSDQVNVGERQLTKEENNDESGKPPLVNHVVAAPKKVSVKESNVKKDLASASSATIKDKPPHSHDAISTPAIFPKSVKISPAISSVTISNPEQVTEQGLVPTGATGPAKAPAKTIQELDQPVISRTAGKKTSTSSALPSGNLKRRRSVDSASTSVTPDSLEPPLKRSMVSSEVGQPIAAEETRSSDKRANTPDPVPQTRIQRTMSKPQAAKAEVKSLDASAKREPVSSKKPLSSGRLPAGQKPVSEVCITTRSAGKRSLESIYERKKSPVSIQGPIGKQIPQVTISTGTSASLSKTKAVAPGSMTKAPSERIPNSSTVEIVMDSHAYVEKMMKNDLDTKKPGSKPDTEQQMATLPTRPQNAWGASFGMIPPAMVATTPVRALSTTPLSSWFLSKGCANFVKHVHFSDGEDDDCSNSGDFTGRSPTSRMISKASPKWRAVSAKKNSFLESLTAQSNWRTWYGKVDVHNLLDPPLARVPEELRTHEVTPLPLPEPAAADASTKKTTELELLEMDIKREKQRGLAFSDQLLMMLQGKTVSGKLLGEEYKTLLH
ncbi:hypothetical protein P3T76_002988 [Phytophthora citrophthora]|uniref:Uncharacterized protein n=1 Tax=Phytophthora citrophthora TaxID=4793 RepID=A0AAD9GVV2_9STRA|nr:hypothetical protein P3T76_002988 [Phytophthora citrophthora]